MTLPEQTRRLAAGGCECGIIGHAAGSGQLGAAAPVGRGQLHEAGRAGSSVTGPRGSRVPVLATTA